MHRMAYSYISGASIKAGLDTIEITSNGDTVVNAKLVTIAEGEDLSLLSGRSINKVMKGAKKHIAVITVVVSIGNSIQIRLNTNTGIMFVDVYGAFVDGEGLLGAAAGTGPTGLFARDGVTDLTGHWNTFAENWQVNGSDAKLFQNSTRYPQYPAGCVYEAEGKATSSLRRRRLMDDDAGVSLDAATSACANAKRQMKDFCISDVLATNDIELLLTVSTTDSVANEASVVPFGC